MGSDKGDPLVDKLWWALLAMQRHPWEQGLATHAAIDASRFDLVRLLAHDAIIRQGDDGRLGVTRDSDLVHCGACGEAVAYLARGGDPQATEVLDRQALWFAQTCPRGESGILFLSGGRAEVGAETVYMVVPFLVAIGHAEDAEVQYRLHRKRLLGVDTGLWGRLYDDAASRWMSDTAWAAGNGWVVSGLARALRIGAGWLDDDIKVGWQDDARSLLDAVAPHERPDGRFHDVLNDSTSFVDGAAGLMFAYCAFTGIADGWLADTWAEPAHRWIRASLARVDEDGLVREVSGAPRFDRPGTSAAAQAFALLALRAEARATHATLDSRS